MEMAEQKVSTYNGTNSVSHSGPHFYLPESRISSHYVKVQKISLADCFVETVVEQDRRSVRRMY